MAWTHRIAYLSHLLRRRWAGILSSHCNSLEEQQVRRCSPRVIIKLALPPQLQLIVVLGSQYAALAKNVKGLNALICAVESAVIVCLLAKLSVTKVLTSEGKGVAKMVVTVAAAKATIVNNRDIVV